MNTHTPVETTIRAHMSRLVQITRSTRFMPVVVIAFALGLGACAPSLATVGSASVQAPQPGGPSATAPAGTPAPGELAGGEPVAGTVSAVNGSTLTITRPQQNTTATVQLSSDVVVIRDNDVSLSDVKVGETIYAVGTQSGTNFAAVRIRVGANAGQTSETPQAPDGTTSGAPNGSYPGPGDPSGTPPAGDPSGTPPAGAPSAPGGGGNNPGGGAMGTPVVGTVTAVSSDALTVTDSNGATLTVTISENGRVVRQQTVGTSEITVGSSIFATGQEQNGVFVATSILLTPATTQP